ncbi:MAG: hypothetical protein K0S38_1035, partial [Candidatus Paceibacter sp.]|nr:hypothetical protein [Candidatus Paceibacter sp.]
SSAVIAEYDYHSREIAKQALMRYSFKHTLILFASSDPLYAELKAALRNNPASRAVFIDYKYVQSKGTPLAPEIERASKAALAILDTQKISFFASTTPVTATLNKNSIRLDMPTQQHAIPVLVKSTYFPAWQTEDKEPYLATPAYILVFTNSSTELNFGQPKIVPISLIVTLLSIGILGFMIYNNYHERRHYPDLQ